MKHFSDITELLTEMYVAGVPTDQAVEWIARAIKIGKAAERAVQDEARSKVIREKTEAKESAQ